MENGKWEMGKMRKWKWASAKMLKNVSVKTNGNKKTLSAWRGLTFYIG